MLQFQIKDTLLYSVEKSVTTVYHNVNEYNIPCHLVPKTRTCGMS